MSCTGMNWYLYSMKWHVWVWWHTCMVWNDNCWYDDIPRGMKWNWFGMKWQFDGMMTYYFWTGYDDIPYGMNFSHVFSWCEVRTMMIVTHKKSLRPGRWVAQALRSGVWISLGEELREAGLPKQPSVWLRKSSGRRSMIETLAAAWPKSRSYRNNWTGCRQSIAADGSGAAAGRFKSRVWWHHGVRPGSPTRFTRWPLTHPLWTNQVTSWPFVVLSSTGLHFYSFLLRLCTGNEMHFWASRSRWAISSTKSPRRPRIAPTQSKLVRPCDDEDEDWFTFLIFSHCSNNATNTSYMWFLSSLSVYMYILYILSYSTYFLTLASFWFWHALWFVRTAIRAAGGFQAIACQKGGCSTRSYSSIFHIFLFFAHRLLLF